MRRIIARTEINVQGYFGRVYRDTETDEYIVRVFFYREGHKPEVISRYDYFTDDKKDAISTMYIMLTQGM